MKPIYVSSKRQHVELWRTWRKRGYNIISSWIDLEGGVEIDKLGREYWPVWLAEAARAEFLIFYAAPWDGRQEGALLEIGAALTAGRTVLCVGVSESVKTADGEWADFTYHPSWLRVLDLDAAFKMVAASIDEDPFLVK
jgi:hypothetical protein